MECARPKRRCWHISAQTPLLLGLPTSAQQLYLLSNMRGWAAASVALAVLCGVHAEVVLEALQRDDTCADSGDCDLSLAQLRGLQESVPSQEAEVTLETKAGRATAAADSAEVKRLRWLSIVCALGMATAVGCCRGWGGRGTAVQGRLQLQRCSQN